MLACMGHAEAASNTAELTGIFQDFCLAQQPDLAGMEKKAADLHGTQQTDQTINTGPGRSLHQETWMVRRSDVLYQLTAMAGDAAAGPYRAVGCGVTAGEADGPALVQSLDTVAGLGPPDRHVPGNGQQGDSVAWTKLFGLNSGHVLLSYGGALTTGASLHLVLPKLPK